MLAGSYSSSSGDPWRLCVSLECWDMGCGALFLGRVLARRGSRLVWVRLPQRWVAQWGFVLHSAWARSYLVRVPRWSVLGVARRVGPVGAARCRRVGSLVAAYARRPFEEGFADVPWGPAFRRGAVDRVGPPKITRRFRWGMNPLGRLPIPPSKEARSFDFGVGVSPWGGIAKGLTSLPGKTLPPRDFLSGNQEFHWALKAAKRLPG